MLDKSLPYYNIIMRRPGGLACPDIELPGDYSFTAFDPDDPAHIAAWAEIETSVLEFDNATEAAEYFNRDYAAYPDEAARRIWFLSAPNGKKIGTISAWFSPKQVKERTETVPSIHWVAIMPEYQGRGLGMPLITFGIQKSIEIDGHRDIYLHTQTWSHTAFHLYRKTGFKAVKEDTFNNHKNDYDQAMDVLGKIQKKP